MSHFRVLSLSQLVDIFHFSFVCCLMLVCVCLCANYVLEPIPFMYITYIKYNLIIGRAIRSLYQSLFIINNFLMILMRRYMCHSIQNGH